MNIKLKQNKYGNTPTYYDNIRFDSKKEANRYAELKLLLRAGEIMMLILQPKYVLIHSFIYRGKRIGAMTYSADFEYVDKSNMQTIVEDAKSVSTRKNEAYKMRKKLFMREYPGLEFREV